MNVQPLVLTAASQLRSGIQPPQQQRPLYACEARDLILRPFFIARLALKEAQRLRVVLFDFTGRFRKVSRHIDELCRTLDKELTSGMVHAERNLMRFLEYRFFEDLKPTLEMLRLQIDQFCKSVAPDATDLDINSQAELARFLARMACEYTEDSVMRMYEASAKSARYVDGEIKMFFETTHTQRIVTPPALVALEELQKAIVVVENIASSPQTKVTDQRRQKVLEDTLDVAVRKLKTTPIVQSDRYACCGVCSHYSFPGALPGHCLWRNFKAQVMRPACKRFKRINNT